ncbi:hypothetical protein FA95DRAFT_1502715, partial [Auriscalpium vulgare]
MRNAPIGWATVLRIEDIHSLSELLRVVRAKSTELVGKEPARGARPFFGRSTQSDARHARAGDALLVDYDVDEHADPAHAQPPQFDPRPAAYAVNANRSAHPQGPRRGARDPPPGGYLFPKADYKVSSEAPPSPCKVCGSAKHWDKECPHWAAWSPRRDVNAITVEHDTDPQQDIEYHEAFIAYVMRSPMSNITPVSALWCEALSAQATALRIDATARAARPPRPWFVEIPEEIEQRTALPASSEHILEHVDTGPTLAAAPPPSAAPPPPAVIPIKPSRRPAPGHSAVGIAALSFPGFIGAPDGPSIKFRADSGADLSLISAEYLAGLPVPHRPRVRQGLKMELYQLTSGAPLAGYVSLPVLVQSREGPLLQFTAECYVVPGMTVPVLLGEDFHVTYELGVQRRVQGGSIIQVGDHPHSIAASSSKLPGSPIRLIKNAAQPIARAAADVRIAPFSNRQVPLRFLSATPAEWYLEKTVLGQTDGSFLVTTPTLLTAEHPTVSVSNPSAHPRIVRAGETIGRLRAASQF